jgi:hypothetical protein
VALSPLAVSLLRRRLRALGSARPARRRAAAFSPSFASLPFSRSGPRWLRWLPVLRFVVRLSLGFAAWGLLVLLALLLAWLGV